MDPTTAVLRTPNTVQIFPITIPGEGRKQKVKNGYENMNMIKVKKRGQQICDVGDNCDDDGDDDDDDDNVDIDARY